MPKVAPLPATAHETAMGEGHTMPLVQGDEKGDGSRKSIITRMAMQVGSWKAVANRDAINEKTATPEDPPEEEHSMTDNEAKLTSYKSSRDWWAVLFSSERIWPNWRPMLLTVLATTVFVVAEEYGDADLKSQDISAAVAGLTFVVGFLMSMRINDAWKNWYEARSAWQKLIGGTSKLFQLCWAGSNSSANDEFTIIWRIKMYSLCLSFPVILKNALRGQSVQSDQRDLNFIMQGSPAAMKMIPHILNPKHAPLPRLRARYHKGVISDALMQVVQLAVPDLEEVAAKCSQIKGTPFVFQAGVHFRTLLLLYCCTLPLLLIHAELSIITLYIMMVIISFAILTLDEVAVRLEQPFGLDSTDLPLGEFCNIIKEELNVTRHSDLGGAMDLLDSDIADASGDAMYNDLTGLVATIQKDKRALLQTFHPQRAEDEAAYTRELAVAESINARSSYGSDRTESPRLSPLPPIAGTNPHSDDDTLQGTRL